MSPATTAPRVRVDWTFPAWSVLSFIFALMIQGAVMAFTFGQLNQRLIAVEARVQAYDRTASTVDKMDGRMEGMRDDLADIKRQLAASATERR